MEGWTASTSFSNSARVMVVAQPAASLSGAGLLQKPLMVTTTASSATSGAGLLTGAAAAGCPAGAGFGLAAWPKATAPSSRQTKKHLYILGIPPEKIEV